MGDTPYVPKDRDLLLHQMKEIRDMVDDQLADPSLSQSLFVMHVGDIQHGKKTNCVEEFFTRMYLDIKYESPLPFLLLVGDNDWNDCPDPTAAKKISDDLFIGLENYWLDWVFEQNFTNVEEVTKYLNSTSLMNVTKFVNMTTQSPVTIDGIATIQNVTTTNEITTEELVTDTIEVTAMENVTRTVSTDLGHGKTRRLNLICFFGLLTQYVFL
jgi:hypothetical protein